MFTNFTVTSTQHEGMEWVFRDGRLTNYQQISVVYHNPQLMVRCDDTGRVKRFAGERRSCFARDLYHQIAYGPTPEPWRYRDPATYLNLVRCDRQALAEGKRVRLHWTDHDGMDATQFRAEFLAALDKRISLKAGPSPSWRKLDSLYQTELSRDWQAIEEKIRRRVRLTYLGTPELRRRFAHLITPYHED